MTTIYCKECGEYKGDMLEGELCFFCKNKKDQSKDYYECKYIQTYESFNVSTKEELFGKDSNLEKQFSDIVVAGLMSDDEDVAHFWSTFNAVKIYTKEGENQELIKELEYRITDGENPKKVILDIIDKIDLDDEFADTKEIIRLRDKIKDMKI